MSIHSKPIAERIEWLFGRARDYSAQFCSPENWLARERYLARHPTAIAVLKCMDGRINIPVATNTPLGIIQPFRNLGGIFDLGWPHLGEVLAGYVQRCIREGRQVLLVVTYHFSRGSTTRGCAGFDYDTDAAKAHTLRIKEQVESAFGRAHGTVFPLVCGFETDEDALLVHGSDGSVLDLASLRAEDADSLPQRLAALLPEMPERIRRDLLPLLAGNLRHIAEVRQTQREAEIEHREWMICIGRGFDFLHMPNLALIVGPYSPELADPVAKAAGIIAANMRQRRIPDDGFLLLASVPYEEIGVDRARAELKARFLADFSAGVIAAHEPALAQKMHVRQAVLDWRSRRLEQIGDAG
ncbi:MAG TPA: hypothetical protein VFY24_11735 [Azospira sp.]|nr:hypothetical protein [Azospira sp.]